MSQKNNQEETKQKCRLGTASSEITGGGGASTSLRSTNPRPGKVTLDVYRGRKTTLQQQVRPSSLGYPNDV